MNLTPTHPSRKAQVGTYLPTCLPTYPPSARDRLNCRMWDVACGMTMPGETSAAARPNDAKVIWESLLSIIHYQ